MPVKFTVTLYGSDEHVERVVTEYLRIALDKEHIKHNTAGKFSAMLIGETKYEPSDFVEQRVIEIA